MGPRGIIIVKLSFTLCFGNIFNQTNCLTIDTVHDYSIASAQKLKLQLWARHYNCQLSLSPYSLLLLRCEVLRLTEAYRSKIRLFQFVSKETPSFWFPLELDNIAETSQEESSTFIKN